eukprot:CAMPEP_0197436752 /NCGR_PEP_ID=MMETSP1175-20131217/4163_1 /TAXON_ID=1003142 /ORGANISM="Triceratium dubium, Strain CCMP147" /LENGTH=323 /DNA_ID=CAMNT_0042966127 /DNA_START=290 /DNA_END=1264 /DNA_ORIENTATION=+
MGWVALMILLLDLVTVKCKLQPTEKQPFRLPDDASSFDIMRIRHSCRSFQCRRLSKNDHMELMRCVKEQSVPSAWMGEIPIRFEYISAPLSVWPVVNAQEFLVAVAPKEYNRVAIMDIGRSLQKIVLQATRMGIGTCWIGPGANHESIKQHLGKRFDEDTDGIVCVCAIGYESSFYPAMLRVMKHFVSMKRLPLTDLFFADPSLSEPLDTTVEPYCRYGDCYEACRWAPSSFNAQPTRCVVVAENISAGKGGSGAEQVRQVDFYATTRSRYYAILALGIWLAHWELGCNEHGISGHFQIISTNDEDARETPRYCISWIPSNAY